MKMFDDHLICLLNQSKATLEAVKEQGGSGEPQPT